MTDLISQPVQSAPTILLVGICVVFVVIVTVCSSRKYVAEENTTGPFTVHAGLKENIIEEFLPFSDVLVVNRNTHGIFKPAILNSNLFLLVRRDWRNKQLLGHNNELFLRNQNAHR